MPDATPDIPLVAVKRSAVGSALLAGFAAALFASAFLVFSVQPVVSRLVLPKLGGSPAVWNTCVCFFQAALLLGYGYAHLATGRLRPRAQVALHAAVLAAGLASMPLSLGAGAPPAESSPVGWLLVRLALGVGLPFVAIAATAPMLQVWFARTAHPHARDPYFLYAASNVGSLLALLGYPVLIETTLDLSDQARLWSAGFAATAAAVLACGVSALRHAAAPAPVARATAEPPTAVPAAERLRWVALAFVPSALMLAVTTHITTDIAAVPLFWVAPLAVYILTFVLAFARRPLLTRRALLVPQGAALAVAGALGVGFAPNAVALLAPLAAFALTAAVCHAELAERRPAVRHLTGYFLLISAGGALGGLFNALLAPVLFPIPLEYPLLLVAACLLRPPLVALPALGRVFRALRLDVAIPAAMIALALAVVWVAKPAGAAAQHPATQLAATLLAGAVLLWFSGRRTPFALALAGCLLAPGLVGVAADLPVVARGFFGVHRVRLLPAENLVALQHGTTMHGLQGTRPGEELTPFGYYHRAGPFGRVFAALARRPEPISAVGVLGLGTGSLGCYARPGEAWTFHEIDPVVERLARDGRWFRFMAGCGNGPAVVLGDAWVTLANTGNRYDVLVVDVFSSDGVPVHLLTREALALYFARLKPGGLVVFHVSNRYLDLVPVVARLAADAGAPARHLRVLPAAPSRRESGAEVVAVAAPGGELDALAADGWGVPRPGPALWTDERSDILGVVRWR